MSSAALEPTLPKPWMMTRQPSRGHVEVLECLVADDADAAAGGLTASARAADVDGLAGDDAVTVWRMCME